MLNLRGLRSCAFALAVPVAVGFAISSCSAATVSAQGSKSRDTGQLARFEPKRPPESWKRATSSQGSVLSYPPAFVSVRADPGSVSEAVIRGSGTYDAYLNVTPQQGAERLRGFATFRLDHLHDEETAVHEDAERENLSFRAGRGSCVIDDYLTKIGARHYKEIACLVRGTKGGSVIVAAALYGDWSRMASQLQSAVESFDVA